MVWHQPRQVLIDVSAGFDASPEFYSSETGHIVLKKKSAGKSGTHSPRPGTNRGAETDLKFLPIRDISAFIFHKPQLRVKLMHGMYSFPVSGSEITDYSKGLLNASDYHPRHAGQPFDTG